MKHCETRYPHLFDSSIAHYMFDAVLCGAVIPGVQSDVDGKQRVRLGFVWWG